MTIYRSPRSREDKESVEINASIVRETGYALLLDFGGKKPEWFPKSQITYNKNGTFSMPQWLAIEKGAV